MLQVQMLKDGKRTVIVISGAEQEQDELAYRLINTYYASALKVNGLAEAVPCPTDSLQTEQPQTNATTFKTVEDLEPVDMPEPTIPGPEAIARMEDYSIARSRNKHIISNGFYSGITAIDALHKDKEAALVRLHKYATEMKDSEERDEIIVTCKQYMRELPMTTQEFLTRERKCEFIRNISNMTSVTPFINGYIDVRSFIETATDAEVCSAVEALSYALAKRGSL